MGKNLCSVSGLKYRSDREGNERREYQIHRVCGLGTIKVIEKSLVCLTIWLDQDRPELVAVALEIMPTLIALLSFTIMIWLWSTHSVAVCVSEWEFWRWGYLFTFPPKAWVSYGLPRYKVFTKWPTCLLALNLYKRLSFFTLIHFSNSLKLSCSLLFIFYFSPINLMILKGFCLITPLCSSMVNFLGIVETTSRFLDSSFEVLHLKF